MLRNGVHDENTPFVLDDLSPKDLKQAMAVLRVVRRIGPVIVSRMSWMHGAGMDLDAAELVDCIEMVKGQWLPFVVIGPVGTREKMEARR